ncbi:hypothetical protein BH23GEM9_BH23GEM9_19770 [soil metagenome]
MPSPSEPIAAAPVRRSPRRLAQYVSAAPLIALCLGGDAVRLSAQFVVPACDMRCPPPRLCAPFDGACNDYNASVTKCQTEQASCQAKFMMYDAYLQQMGMGVTLYNLPALYREELAQYFPAANLADVRFGYSNRQPDSNATTDCDRIYFNNAGYVDAVRTGTLQHDNSALHHFSWLLHELTHFEQCRQVGSRDAYAKMWWDHLSEAEFQTLIETGNWMTVHDQMQMENEADTRRDQVLMTLPGCCIHPFSRLLIRPLTVAPLSFTPAQPSDGQAMQFQVSAANGAEPLSYRWVVYQQGTFGMTEIGTTPMVTYTPSSPGNWTVQLQVTQPAGALQNDHGESRTFTVSELLPVVTGVSVSPGSVTSGASATGTVQVSSLKPNITVQVQLASNRTAAEVPQSVAVTSSRSTGSATFPITTHLVPGTQTASITATAAGGAASASLTVVGPSLEPMQFVRTELNAGDLLDVLLKLDRPPRVDITVVLESSDARAIGVPRQVVFRAGQQEQTLRLTVSADVVRELAVTLRAYSAHDGGVLRDQVIRVLPKR